MLFLKSLLFLPLNMLLPFLFVVMMRHLLFFPRTEKYIRGWKIPLTPGIVAKYHRLLLDKVNNLLAEFQRETTGDYEGSKLQEWEEKIFQRCFNWAEEHIRLRYLPRKILHGIRVLVAELGRELVRQFIRKFVPYLMENFQVAHYVELAKRKVSLEILLNFYDRYIYKYSLIVMCGFALLIGIGNMIIYIIIGG